MNVFHRVYCCTSIFPTCQEPWKWMTYDRDLQECAIAISRSLRCRSLRSIDRDRVRIRSNSQQTDGIDRPGNWRTKRHLKTSD
ncbi:MAG: hypothetical protein J7647_28150 [Cyanobacteria bacterium SBLK]|nr:hypothetical protein [Cyanobacteria bacterium SBLK]